MSPITAKVKCPHYGEQSNLESEAVEAVANLYRLNEDETAKLLGVAAFLSPLALFEAFAKGAPIKNMAMGWGNLIGIWGVKLSAEGLFGPITAIEGNFGYVKAAADTYDLSKIEDAANVNRGIINTGIKPYSCCRQHHSAVDAILRLRDRCGITRFGDAVVQGRQLNTWATISSR